MTRYHVCSAHVISPPVDSNACVILDIEVRTVRRDIDLAQTILVKGAVNVWRDLEVTALLAAVMRGGKVSTVHFCPHSVKVGLIIK